MLKIISDGIKKLPNLELFLEEEFKLYADPKKIEAVVGWGHKETATKARALAYELKVPYLALEDGFIRSLDLGVNKAPPLSLSVDPVGCYYDAGQPSYIEKMLAEPSWYDDYLKQQAQSLIAKICKYKLSKYNRAPVLDLSSMPTSFVTEEKVLILDQCAGDASLTLGQIGESEILGKRILDRVEHYYPKAKIYLKCHPDVIAGKRKGLFDLKNLPKDKEIVILEKEVNLISLMSYFEAVFTVTSQAGFEALMLGKRVHVFGLPFYAGYGLTFDEVRSERRSSIQGVTLEMLFAAAYLKLCRYINPITQKRADLDEVLELLHLQREINEENRGGAVVFGVKRWKRPILNAYLGSTQGQVYYTNNPHKALKLAQSKNLQLNVWSSKRNPLLDEEANAQGLTIQGIEDGFLRSQGLGCNHVRPFSLVFDHEGIYYDPQKPSRLESILNTIKEHPQHELLCTRANFLIKQILKAKLTKYNVGVADEENLASFKAQMPIDKKLILVPGQVEDDASVLRAGGEIKSNATLLEAVRQHNKDAFIIYKPHPDVLALNRQGGKSSETQGLFDLKVTNLSISALYDLVDEVHVLTSQSGFEAILRKLPVTVYGKPFYAGWGLTYDFQEFPRRKAHLTLEELIAGVLILYPRYFDWCTMQFMRPEDAVYRLNHMGKVPQDSLFVRFVRQIYALKRGIYYSIKGETE